MLMRHGLIVLAMAAAVAGAGVAIREATGDDGAETRGSAAQATTRASTALRVSRRADPTIDRYTWTTRTTTPLRRMTSAQRWISTHQTPFVAYDSAPQVSRNLLGWATRPEVHVYVNAAGPNVYNAAGVRDAAPYLLKVGGTPVRVDGWDVIDVRKPAARHWWLYGSDGKASCNRDPGRRAALDLIACGYTGLWIDDILTSPGDWYKPNPRLDPAGWGAAEVALLQELRAALPAGVPFTINAHWTDVDFPYAAAPSLDPDAPLVRAAKLADQLVIEGGAIDAGLNYAGSLADSWSYPRLLAYADALHAQGAKVQWEKTNSDALIVGDPAKFGPSTACSDGAYAQRPGWRVGSTPWRDNVRAAAFNLATALLVWMPGDGVGDICDYPGRSFRGYGQDLGAPVGPRTQAGAVTSRLFEDGMVAVNPSDTSQTVALPPGRAGVDFASTASKADDRLVSSVTLGPRSATVVRFAAPSPTTPVAAVTTP